MSAQHSPGPWFVLTFEDGSMAIQPEIGFMVTPLKPRAGFESDIPNFKLMAAAPELLAALTDTLATLESLAAKHKDGMDNLVGTSVFNARAAIAKAKPAPAFTPTLEDLRRKADEELDYYHGASPSNPGREDFCRGT